MKKRLGILAVCIVGLSSSGIGCARFEPARSVPLFHAGDYPQALYEQEKRVASGIATEEDKGKKKPPEYPPQDHALETMRLGMILMEMGDLPRASSIFKETIGEIGEFGRTEEEVKGEAKALNLFGKESSAPYKGHPYERMALLEYWGVAEYHRGLDEGYKNALAGFQNAILEDYARELLTEVQAKASQNKEIADAIQADPEQFSCDSVFAHYMSAQARIQINDPEEKIRESLQDAREMAERHARSGRLSGIPGEYFDLSKAREANLLVIVGMKREPVKYRTGPHGSHCKFMAELQAPEHSCRILLDDKVVGTAVLMEDFLWQAITRGGREMDAINEGKADFKKTADVIGDTLIKASIATAISSQVSGNRNAAIASVIIALLGLLFTFASAATTPSADIRHWEMMPGQLHVLAAKVPPGKRKVTVEFLDASGNVIPNLTQTWRDMNVREKGQQSYYFRSVQAKAGVHSQYPPVWPTYVPPEVIRKQQEEAEAQKKAQEAPAAPK